MKSRNHSYILKIAIVGIFAAISFALSVFPKFNVFPAAPWLDVDFSDAPALFVSLAIDPVSGFLVVLIKSLIHLTVSHTGHVGLIANILNGGSLVLVAGAVKWLFDRMGEKKPFAVVSTVCAIPVQVLCAIVANLYVLLPAYGIDLVKMFGSTGAYVAIVVGHNLIKDALACTLALTLYFVLLKYVRRWFPAARK